VNEIDISDTIIPKSDQLNADDLITGPIMFTIQGVRKVPDPKQSIIIAIDQGRQPYKPCLSMRRVLARMWGKNASLWVGRSLVLFCDPSVTFGRDKVGGIRISHMSHINGRQSMMLTTTRGRRSEYTVEPLNQPNGGQNG
jgi:hypothetical protein